ncbi:MAG: sterol desaturase family protein [Flavobacteriales bacterium]|jgi:sterol desaturase/sphingolipid hydroxylase (fatty acid hydroxylase superfamily)|nr:sterol desaturase family protein [Flavobacteriales bacterium]
MLTISFFSGVALWTFTEYMLHRFLGHEHKGKNFFKDEHSLHHQRVHYFAPAGKKIAAAIAVAVSLFLILNLIVAWTNALAFVLGLMGMYGLYEYVHTRYHRKGPVAKIFIVLRKHHFYHHFHQPKLNHGVTTRIWDRVFGTFHRVETVTVPRKMTMDWLMSGDEIAPAYTGHFQLR